MNTHRMAMFTYANLRPKIYERRFQSARNLDVTTLAPTKKHLQILTVQDSGKCSKTKLPKDLLRGVFLYSQKIGLRWTVPLDGLVLS